MNRLVNRSTLATIGLGSVLPVLLLVFWQFAAVRYFRLLPTPVEVLKVLFHPFETPINLDSLPLAHSCGISILRVLLGYSLALVLAIPLGLLAGRVAWIRQMVAPMVELGRPICPIAWLPIAILAFGFYSIGDVFWGTEAWRRPVADQLQFAMIAIIAWGGFFPIFLNTVHGVEQVRNLYLDAAKMLGASERMIFLEVVLPGALPSIMTGVRLGLGTAWMVIVAAEIFPGTRAGLGYMIAASHQVAEYQYTFASIVVISAIGLASNYILYYASQRVSRWQILER